LYVAEHSCTPVSPQVQQASFAPDAPHPEQLSRGQPLLNR
jgi:hypothetical protein